PSESQRSVPTSHAQVQVQSAQSQQQHVIQTSSLPLDINDHANTLINPTTIPDTKPDSSGKTPNVYINGLPPHFPEDQLYALASQFGSVRSVRTFTRHVRDSESGYGFV
ncbi:hypothetical protein H0H93_004579, partial [Arthromyces matolae]